MKPFMNFSVTISTHQNGFLGLFQQLFNRSTFPIPYPKRLLLFNQMMKIKGGVALIITAYTAFPPFALH